MDVYGLDNNINKIICSSNTDTHVLTIDTSNYISYNFITLHNYDRVFTIIGLVSLILVSVVLLVVDKISNEIILYIIAGLLIILGGLGLAGFVGLLISCNKFYNIADRIYVYNNPNLGNKTCNISYGFENSSDIYFSRIQKESVGYIQFTVFFLIIILTLLLGFFLLKAKKAINGMNSKNE